MQRLSAILLCFVLFAWGHQARAGALLPPEFSPAFGASPSRLWGAALPDLQNPSEAFLNLLHHLTFLERARVVARRITSVNQMPVTATAHQGEQILSELSRLTARLDQPEDDPLSDAPSVRATVPHSVPRPAVPPPSGATIAAIFEELESVDALLNARATQIQAPQTLPTPAPATDGTSDSSTGAVALAEPAEAGPAENADPETAPPVLIPQRAGGLDLLLPGRGDPGQWYLLQTRDDLMVGHWEGVVGSQATGAGALSYADPGALASPFRFYRVCLSTPPKITVRFESTLITNAHAKPVVFGPAQQGGSPSRVILQVINDGGASLDLSSLSLPTGFVLEEAVPALNTPLVAGRSLLLSVRVDTNAAPGSYFGNLTLQSNDPVTPTFQFTLHATQESANPCDGSDGTRGLASVFKDGVFDWNNQVGVNANGVPLYAYKPMSTVCLGSLGQYDSETGALIAGNGGKLTGRWGETTVVSIGQLFPDYASWPNIMALMNASNDFSVDPVGTPSTQRETIAWSSEVHAYHWVDAYRRKHLNESFLNLLNLDSERDQNLRRRQFRADLNPQADPARYGKPYLQVTESFRVNAAFINTPSNILSSQFRTRANIDDNASKSPLSGYFDPEVWVGDYAGLVSNWVVGFNQGFPSNAFYGTTASWKTNINVVVNDGISSWVSYLMTGDPEINEYFVYAIRSSNDESSVCGQATGSSLCGGFCMACRKGQNVRNVMMYDHASDPNSPTDGVFPFKRPTGFNQSSPSPWGVGESNLASLFIAAIFYDIAHLTGLGLRKADLLFWKSMSLMMDRTILSVPQYGDMIISAARSLWPDVRPGFVGKSIYEKDLIDVLASRGIHVLGQTDFRNELPASVGTYPDSIEVSSSTGFASVHPDTQPTINSYGSTTFFRNGYRHPTDYILDTNQNPIPDPNQRYVAYQFYKHS